MSKPDLDEMSRMAISRAETYLHHAKVMVMREFGPAAEHTHAALAVALASAMMHHEGSQMISGTMEHPSES
jgi:hypothetical protein